MSEFNPKKDIKSEAFYINNIKTKKGKYHGKNYKRIN